MASIGGYDIGFDVVAISSSKVTPEIFSSTIDNEEYMRCAKCNYGGCDVRATLCGCTFHARCLPLRSDGPLPNCPACKKPCPGLNLFAMSYREIDGAKQADANMVNAKGRGRKRKGSIGDGVEEKSPWISERRTGRWTTEEMTYCDKLIEKFEYGALPVADGVKLNEFLGNMLKSKQSRLTKKMKNAKLSTKMFQRNVGCLNLIEAREFSALEESFFESVPDMNERAEIKFHMQKEWREQISRVCATICQPLDTEAWLASVEEMDRRSSRAKDAARMKKRKLMMGIALRTDSKNLEHGVFIEQTDAEIRAYNDNGPDGGQAEHEMLSVLNEDRVIIDTGEKFGQLHGSPFLAKVTAYLERHGVPFEHVDLWVPSFVPNEPTQNGQTSCRLCFAGNATVEKLVAEDKKATRPLGHDELFNYFAFGDYSQKFSFDVGSGLPGRVYETGRPTWEQGIHNAPDHHFERAGGANQWGIKTVVGIPIASPNVGRIVVTLYSCFDRSKDEDLVSRLSEEFTRLMPSPKWKLVVDIGDVEEIAAVPAVEETSIEITGVQLDEQNFGGNHLVNITSTVSHDTSTGKDTRINEVIALLGKFMPSDPQSINSPFLSGYMSLRLLLLRQSRTLEEEELVRTMLDSYSSFYSGGRDGSDIALMLARDFMYLNGSQQAQSSQYNNMHHNMMSSSQQQNMSSSNSGLSLFGLPSIGYNIPNYPPLTPIPTQGSIDGLSIVSN